MSSRTSRIRADGPTTSDPRRAGGNGKEALVGSAALLAIAAAEQELWVQRDSVSWLGMLAPDADIVAGRGPEPGPYDVEFDRDGYAALLAYQLEDRAFGLHDAVLSHESVRERPMVPGQTDIGTVEVTRVLRYGVSTKELVRERYLLTMRDLGWRVIALRYWPEAIVEGPDSAEGEVVRFDPDSLARADASADAAAAVDPRKKATAYFRALRYAEAASWFERSAESAQGTPGDWLEAAWSAAFAGKLVEARRDFLKALALDPTLPVPDAARRPKSALR